MPTPPISASKVRQAPQSGLSASVSDSSNSSSSLPTVTNVQQSQQTPQTNQRDDSNSPDEQTDLQNVTTTQNRDQIRQLSEDFAIDMSAASRPENMSCMRSIRSWLETRLDTIGSYSRQLHTSMQGIYQSANPILILQLKLGSSINGQLGQTTPLAASIWGEIGLQMYILPNLDRPPSIMLFFHNNLGATAGADNNATAMKMIDTGFAISPSQDGSYHIENIEVVYEHVNRVVFSQGVNLNLSSTASITPSVNIEQSVSVDTLNFRFWRGRRRLLAAGALAAGQSLGTAAGWFLGSLIHNTLEATNLLSTAMTPSTNTTPLPSYMSDPSSSQATALAPTSFDSSNINSNVLGGLFASVGAHYGAEFAADVLESFPSTASDYRQSMSEISLAPMQVSFNLPLPGGNTATLSIFPRYNFTRMSNQLDNTTQIFANPRITELPPALRDEPQTTSETHQPSENPTTTPTQPSSINFDSFRGSAQSNRSSLNQRRSEGEGEGENRFISSTRF